MRRQPAMERRLQIPIVDLFSGCGGFSEGFVNKKFGDLGFRLALAIDNDARAHETHLLRNVFHQFDEALENIINCCAGKSRWMSSMKIIRANLNSLKKRHCCQHWARAKIKTVTFTVLLKKHSQAQVIGLWSAALPAKHIQTLANPFARETRNTTQTTIKDTCCIVNILRSLPSFGRPFL